MTRVSARGERPSDPVEAAEAPAKRANSLRLAAVLLGLLFVLANSYWIHWAGNRDAYSPFMPMWSLFPNIVALVFALALVNRLMLRLAPRLALDSRDQLVIYAMVGMATSLSSADFLYYLAPIISYPRWVAAGNPRWEALFTGTLPQHLAVNDLAAAAGYFEGSSSFYHADYLLAWLRPLAWWGAFVSLVWAAMLCMNRLLLARWAEHERLAFPLATVPLLVTTEQRTLFSDRAVWVAVVAPLVMSLLGILNQLWPAVPVIPLWFDLHRYIGQIMPWGAQRYVIVEVTPITLGMAFLVPREISLSLWLFNLLWRAAAITGAQLGITTASGTGFPHYEPTEVGGGVAIVFTSLWLSRPYLRGIALGIVRGRRDHAEATALRLAAGGLVACIALLAVFLVRAGFSPFIMCSFLGLFFLVSLAAARLRAQAGPSSVELSYGSIIPDAAGTLRLTQAELGLFTFLSPMTYSSRSMPMGVQTESMFLMSSARTRGMIWIVLVTGAATVITTFWSALDVGYRLGVSSAKANVWACDQVVPGWFAVLNAWTTSPATSNHATIGALGAGALITLLLSFALTRIPNWPLHPVGFVLGGSFFIHVQVIAIFLAWLAKTLIIRYGGVRMHRRALGVCTGLLIGGCTGTMLELFSGQILRVIRES